VGLVLDEEDGWEEGKEGLDTDLSPKCTGGNFIRERKDARAGAEVDVHLCLIARVGDVEEAADLEERKKS
jgi:hypothetical protein